MAGFLKNIMFSMGAANIRKFLAPARRSPAYLFCGVFFLVIAWSGFQYGAFLFYCAPALISIIQFFYPTQIGWFLVFTPVLAGSGFYIFIGAQDVFAMLTGSRPNIFVNAADSVLFGAGILLLIGLAVWLWFQRPRRELANTKL